MIANDGATTVQKRRYLWLKRSSPFIIILHGSYHSLLLLQDLLSCCKKLFMSLTRQRLHFVYVQLDALFNSLNVKGIRERSLQKELETLYEKISTALQKRSKELAQRYAVEEALVRRSERVCSAPRLTGFLAYVNRLRMP
jgi:hypothetical protein